jgi:hypothetical protein
MIRRTNQLWFFKVLSGFNHTGFWFMVLNKITNYKNGQAQGTAPTVVLFAFLCACFANFALHF